MTEPAPSDILTAPEAAELLRISPRTVWELSNRGEMPVRKVGRLYRYSRMALLAWVAEGQPSQPAQTAPMLLPANAANLSLDQLAAGMRAATAKNKPRRAIGGRS